VPNGSTPIDISSSRFSIRVVWLASRRRLSAAWWLIQMIPIVMNDVA
jgi:hypothetical protein